MDDLVPQHAHLASGGTGQHADALRPEQTHAAQNPDHGNGHLPGQARLPHLGIQRDVDPAQLGIGDRIGGLDLVPAARGGLPAVERALRPRATS